jgi:hypothetical protein
MGVIGASTSASGTQRDQAVWTRVDGIAGQALDLLHAWLARSQYAPHVHEEFAVGACTEGVERIRYRGQLHHAGPGTVIILEPGEPHTGGPALATGLAYRAMYPREALLSAGSVGHPHFRVDPRRLHPGHRTTTQPATCAGPRTGRRVDATRLDCR